MEHPCPRYYHITFSHNKWPIKTLESHIKAFFPQLPDLQMCCISLPTTAGSWFFGEGFCELQYKPWKRCGSTIKKSLSYIMQIPPKIYCVLKKINISLKKKEHWIICWKTLGIETLVLKKKATKHYFPHFISAINWIILKDHSFQRTEFTTILVNLDFLLGYYQGPFLIPHYLTQRY